MTGETITAKAALKAALAEVRASGLATEAEEAVLGECRLAARLAEAGNLAGALGLVVPSGEWPVTSARALPRSSR